MMFGLGSNFDIEVFRSGFNFGFQEWDQGQIFGGLSFSA